MSAGSTGGIGPVSVRYAAQIRELLYTQAMQRMQAERERARAAAEAERQERLQPKKKAEEPKPADLKVETGVKTKPSDSAASHAPKADDAQVSASATAQLVDIQA